MTRILKILILLAIFSQTLFAQKNISLAEAESAFQSNSLVLLAQKFNISAAQAMVLQARIWDLPVASVELNLINPQDGKAFDVGSGGQKALAIEQLIYLGGKKKNEIAFAQSNVGLAELQLEQLIRNLRYRLAQTFYSIYFDQKKISSIDMQLSKLDTLIKAYDVQTRKGNLPLKELVRLQSLANSIRSQKTLILGEIVTQRKDLQLITGLETPPFPLVNDSLLMLKFKQPIFSKDSLMAMALSAHIDMKIAKKLEESQDLYLRWQKSLATPDLTTGLSYDQRGGAFQNQVNLTLKMPIPLWNANKGNIQNAEIQLKQVLNSKRLRVQEIRNRIENVWDLVELQSQQLASIGTSANTDLELVYRGTLSNFEKRNITLLEFIDFMESYNIRLLQINEIKKQWILICLNLNYETSTEAF